jgi:OFA family oxalate/formate antiporter-like MFS transporter
MDEGRGNVSASASNPERMPRNESVPAPTRNLGWQVTFAGLGINLALGILYTWSVIKKGIPADWGWSDFDKTLPYSTAVLVFSLMMVPAGRLQDRIGPRFVATLGGILVGVGMILAGLSTWPVLESSADWISKCISQRPRIQQVTIDGSATGGTYRFQSTWGEKTTSAELPFDADAMAVQEALQTLPGLEKVTVTSTAPTEQSPKFVHTVTFPDLPWSQTIVSIQNKLVNGKKPNDDSKKPKITQVSIQGVAPDLIIFFIGFGLLAGTGIGFGYASATPPAVKWFPSKRTGMIAGLVVSGFGLASVYASPLADRLITNFGLENAMFILGAAFLVIVVGLAQMLIPPPKGFVPAGAPVAASAAASVKREDFRPTEMLATPQFYLCWLLYAVGAGAGLMIIPQLATMVAKQVDLVEKGFWLVMSCGVGNGAGRILAGMASDKLGRKRTLQSCFVFQAIVLLVLSIARPESPAGNFAVMLVLAALVGANYGANLAIFPSITKDYYGLKNFGVNYGLVFTAWGCGGFMLAQVASKIYDKLGDFTYNYYGAAVLLVLAAVLAFALAPPQTAQQKAVD